MTDIDKKIIEQNIKAQLAGAGVAPICLSGAPGTSKSTTVGLIAQSLDMNIVTESGPTLTHELLSGLPDTVDASQYQANSIDGTIPQATQWSIPEMVAKAIRAAEGKPTVLLIDDFHMVSPHLQAYFYGLLLERRLGNFKLSDNVAIVLTMNDSDKAGFNGINSAVRNRLAILPVEFNFEYWFKAYGNRLHYMVASFLKSKSNFCMEDETTTIEGYASARAWTAIANELNFHDKDFILKYGSKVAGMQVSKSAADAFKLHINYIDKLNFEDTVKNRVLVDLSTRDQLDSILYAYITNFIITADDGMYLFDLMNANIQQSTFIGFILGELYIKYTLKDSVQMSEGLTFVIDRLLKSPLDYNKYPNSSKDKMDKLFSKDIANLNSFMERAAEYLL